MVKKRSQNTTNFHRMFENLEKVKKFATFWIIFSIFYIFTWWVIVTIAIKVS